MIRTFFYENQFKLLKFRSEKASFTKQIAKIEEFDPHPTNCAPRDHRNSIK